MFSSIGMMDDSINMEKLKMFISIVLKNELMYSLTVHIVA